MTNKRTSPIKEVWCQNIKMELMFPSVLRSWCLLRSIMWKDFCWMVMSF